MAKMNMLQAVNNALITAMNDDEKVMVFGEDVGHFGGVFSDLERVSIHLDPSSNRLLDETIYSASRDAGYVSDDDNARMMRGPDRTTLFIRALTKDKGLVVHHHRRWGTGHRMAPKTR